MGAIFSNKRPLWRGALIGGGRILEGGAYKFFPLLEGALIGGGRLKEGGRLLEDLPYIIPRGNCVGVVGEKAILVSASITPYFINCIWINISMQSYAK